MLRLPAAQERAYQRIRDEIVTGRLPGGTRLKQETLADQLGISRMPVRDALQRLHAEGFVTIEPSRSVVVTQLAPDEVLEAFEIRAVLEGFALRLAMPELRGAVLAEIEDLAARMERATDDVELWVRRHDEFHEYLNQWSHRPRLFVEIQQLRNTVQPYFRMYLRVHHQPEAGVAHHRVVVDAIRRGDVTAAEATMRRHVLSAGRGVVAFLREPNASPARLAANGRPRPRRHGGKR